ncbi:MAG: lytic transglycosylase domain-containing protein [Alphaproteobacteria bacterium]|nr:lytic transglycosylase domain-containing protein [Alphaproteobacteria bacterium]
MKKIFSYFLTILLIVFINFTAHASVLNKTDVKLYKEIFQAHQKGHYITAQSLEKKLSNKLLKGYILFDKYFSSKYKTSKQEINSFIKTYSHLPIANDVYALGKKKNFRLSSKSPKDPVYGSKAGSCSYVRRDEPINLVSRQKFSYLSPSKRNEAKKLSKNLKKLIEQKRLTKALELLESKKVSSLFNQTDIDIVYTAIAFSYFLDGNDDKSLKYAKKAINTSGDSLPLAHWTAALSSWRTKDYKNAAHYFSTAAEHDEGYPLLKSSAGFWAARAYLKMGEFQKVGNYLELASGQPRTFYGLLALYMMGDHLENILDEESHPEIVTKTSFSHPALNRFYALKQVGKTALAEKELAALYLSLSKEKKEKFIQYARQRGFYKELTSLTGVSLDTKERFPLPNWTPLNNWRVKKELVFAFVRQESCFNKHARSIVGARGLMQIMPQTAKIIAKMSGINFNISKMENESYNLALGQNYLLYLMELPAINYNLIFTAVAYNAGPGNLIKWKKQMLYQEDPLLFIESIPSRETRGFVERIMVNFWIYSSLTKSSFESIDAVIQGKWPMYQP